MGWRIGSGLCIIPIGSQAGLCVLRLLHSWHLAGARCGCTGARLGEENPQARLVGDSGNNIYFSACSILEVQTHRDGTWGLRSGDVSSSRKSQETVAFPALFSQGGGADPQH